METPSPAVLCDTLPKGSLSVEQAQERILAAVAPLAATETLPLAQAHGRILGQAVLARMAVPSFTNSAMDGYAVRHADVTSGQALQVVGTAYAGRPWQGTVQAGTCVRIMTGALLPEGADTVVMQENVQRDGDLIRTQGNPQHGENVRHIGEDSQPGDELLPAGRKLNAADIGLLASQGIASVPVVRKVRVAFATTGDELRQVGETLQPGELYDSNRYTLTALLQALQVEVLDLGVVRDTPEAVETAFQQAMQQADVLITTGGVSVGEADYVTATLRRLGEVDFWKIAFKPGKPLAFGKLGNCLFFGLPGNPVSVLATFLLFVRPALLRLQGESVAALPTLEAVTAEPLKKAPGRKDYQRGICWQEADGTWRVRSTGNQGSHVLRSFSQANCLIALPLEAGKVAAGTPVTVIPLAGLL